MADPPVASNQLLREPISEWAWGRNFGTMADGPSTTGIDDVSASILLADTVRRYAQGVSTSSLLPSLRRHALESPGWVARHVFLLVRGVAFCGWPRDLEELLFMHSDQPGITFLAMWSVQATIMGGEEARKRGPLLIRRLESAFVNGKSGLVAEQKRVRAATVERQASFIAALTHIPSRLRAFAPSMRPALARALVGALAASSLPAALALPTTAWPGAGLVLVGAPLHLVHVFETRERCPLAVVFEVVEEQCWRAGTAKMARPPERVALRPSWPVTVCLVTRAARRVRLRLTPSEASLPLPEGGAPWAVLRERIRLESPYGGLPSWDLKGVVVKCHANMPLEELAMTFLRLVGDIFDAEAPLLRLRTYAVKAISPDAGFVEFIPDARSLHDIKRGCSLLEHFRETFPMAVAPGSGQVDYGRAVENFTVSLAACTVACWVLAIRDRHNANILLLNGGRDAGSIVNVDFGFILGLAPGGALSVETAPFKLTSEWVDLMGGEDSPQFERFQSLVAAGLLAVKRQAPRILAYGEAFAEVCARGGAHAAAQLPCFDAGGSRMAGLRDRLMLGLSDDEVCLRARGLIKESLGALSTSLYDAYQQATNAISR